MAARSVEKVSEAAGRYSVRAVMASLRREVRRRPGAGDLDVYGEVVAAVEPGGGYPIKRISLERTLGRLVLFADGAVLETFGGSELAAALSAFAALNPCPLAKAVDLER